MKLLILEPIYEDEKNWLVKYKKQYDDIEKYWDDYYKKNNNIEFDIHVEPLYGTDKETIAGELISTQVLFFKEFEILKQEIDSLIDSNDVLGILITPYLTYKEYRQATYNVYECMEFMKFYDYFIDRVPICIKKPEVLLSNFFDSSVYKIINKNFIEEHSVEIPIVNTRYKLGFEEMFNYFMECYHKRIQESKVKVKTEDK